MPSIRELLLGILLPALISGSVLAYAWARRGGEARAAPFNGALAIALGYACATIVQLGSIAVPSASRTLAARDWLAWVAIAGVVAYAVPAVSRTPRLRALADAALALALVWLCRGGTLAKPGGTATLAAMAVLAVGALSSTQSLARRAPGALVPIVLFLTACATSIASLVSSSALLALLAGASCACFAACAVVGAWNRHFTLHGGAASVGVLVLSGLWINAALYSRMPPAAAGCLCACLFVPWFAVRASARQRSRSREIAHAALLVLPLAIAAVVLAQRAAPEPYY